MGMPSTYDPKMRKTEIGSRLYTYWKKARYDTDSEEFVNFPGFYKWATQNGYTLGAKLFRYDTDEPYNPDNCFWVARSEWVGATQTVRQEYVDTRDRLWMKKWDDTVNRIRLHYGMEPICSTEV